MYKIILKLSITTSIFALPFVLITLVAAEGTPQQDHGHTFTDNLEVCSSESVTNMDVLVERVNFEKISACQLAGISIENLRLLRNGIFAKHGRKFDDPQLQSFFNAQPWYRISDSFSPDSLSKIQRMNVRMIEKIEELKKMQKTRKDDSVRKHADDIDHDNFPKLQSFLIELEKKDVTQVNSNYKKLFSKSRSIPNEECCEKAAPELVFLPDNKSLLMIYRINDRRTDAFWCDSDLYSLNGTLSYKIPFCPSYYVKDEPRLLVNADFTGCCGAYAWDFGLANAETKKSLTFSCGDSDCRDVLLTWLPDTKEILLVLERGSYQFGCYSWKELEINVVNTASEVVGLGKIKSIYLLSPKQSRPLVPSPFALRDLVGVVQLPETSDWALRFVHENQDVFLHLSSKPKGKIEDKHIAICTEPPAADIKIDGKYIGKAPILINRDTDNHKIRFSYGGEKSIEYDMMKGSFKYNLQFLLSK